MSCADRLQITLDRMRSLGLPTRPLWAADDGSVRCGRSLDMIALMEAVGAPTRT